MQPWGLGISVLSGIRLMSCSQSNGGSSIELGREMNVLATDTPILPPPFPPHQLSWTFKNFNKFPFGFKTCLIMYTEKNDKSHGVEGPIPWAFIDK